ncbi:MAG: helix-hairpin-helix domain-containing protein [Pseudomonadota bacterium]
MGKKNKLGISTLVERVEQLVNDALKRIDTLQNQVNDLREQVMERVGFSEKPSEKSNRPTTPASKKTGGSNASAKSSGTAKKTGNSGSTANKSAPKKASSASKSSGAKKDDLTRINGIGPATAKKMQAKGITTIKQLANPSADDQKKLEEFRKLKNFSSWQAEAKKLV